MARPRSMIFGFGVNDADYMVSTILIDGYVKCPAYTAWKDMIMRCYSQKYQEKRPTYIGVTVCDEWRSFMAFRKWWVENNKAGFELDKDILGDSRTYSPNSCIYVPSWLNTFTIDNRPNRGRFPIGVDYRKETNSFRSLCRNPATGKREHIGDFKTPKSAHLAWRKRKLEIASGLKVDMDAIDKRIYPRVVEMIKRAK